MDSIEINKKYREEKKLSKKPIVKKKVVKVVKKKKTKTRGQLIKEYDAIFSKYIRLSSADKKGMCTCVTCGDKKHYKEIQNGHFISRGNYKYRWDEDNCFPQCMPCNIYKSGNYIAYTLFMIGKYGKQKVEEIQNDKELIKISTPELREKIEEYKKKVLQLELK